MKAVVVYESLWGNTAAVARAIAEGIGPDTPALSTAEATDAALAGADLIVAGAPLMQFRLPSEGTRKDLGRYVAKGPAPPDLSHSCMRTWLAGLALGSGAGAAFETRLWWSPGSAARTIQRGLEGAGYRCSAKRQRFVVEGTYGPLREGELERARSWGAELARSLA